MAEDGPFLEGKVRAGDPSSPDDSFLLTLAAVRWCCLVTAVEAELSASDEKDEFLESLGERIFGFLPTQLAIFWW